MIKKIFSNLYLFKKRFPDQNASFSKLKKQKFIYLYAGDVPNREEYNHYIGLSIVRHNENHITHNVLNRYPLKDHTVHRYQSEDVFEHLPYEQLPMVINEIYRILVKGGLFRLSMPDYGCDVLYDRSQKDENGVVLFDPFGGGTFEDGKVLNGGHLWFPTYPKVKSLLERTSFQNITFLHYYDENGNGITHKIDYSKGFIKRTPDNDERVQKPYRPMSLVVDCYK